MLSLQNCPWIFWTLCRWGGYGGPSRSEKASQSQNWRWLWKPSWLTLRPALTYLVATDRSPGLRGSQSSTLSPYQWESLSWMCSLRLLVATKISHYYSQPALRWRTGSFFFFFFMQQMLRGFFPQWFFLQSISSPSCLSSRSDFLDLCSFLLLIFETVSSKYFVSFSDETRQRSPAVVFTVLGRKKGLHHMPCKL